MSLPEPQNLPAALAVHGLELRGGFTPTAADTLPALPDGTSATAVWLVGVVGSGFWPHFKASRFYNDHLADPLDRWSRAIGQELAARYGGLAMFPFDGPPYHPFQRWADRADNTQPSKMMMRLHPVYGLWHAYRFALALPALQRQTPGSAAAPSLGTLYATTPDVCARCSDQPCLQACPVGAYTGEAFLLETCAGHLHSGSGAECMKGGCLARRACPIGQDYRYIPEHATFHMQAFAMRH